MTTSKAIGQLTSISLSIAIIMAALTFFDVLGDLKLFSWMCFIFYLGIALVMIYMAGMAKKVSTPRKGLNVVVGSMGFKFVMSLLLFVGYAVFARPDTYLFIVPFLFFYFFYTIIANYYVLKITRS